MDIYYPFKEKLAQVLSPVLDKDIIIYGYNRSGDFVRWFLEYYYSKKIKAFVDRWEFSPVNTVLHLWAFYYIYGENDTIINVTPYDIPSEFNDTGENWDKTKYRNSQIINLWHMFYTDEDYVPEKDCPGITFYELAENKYRLDITKTIKRQFIEGDGHGYFPTDFRMIYEGIKQYGVDPVKDSILDIGAGKGSAVFSFIAGGFKKIGAVEYTGNIYNVLIGNLNKAGIKYEEKTGVAPLQCNRILDGTIACYNCDASLMSDELDGYNWFFMFNPFPLEILEKVIGNICSSLERKPRLCHIFYAEPVGHQYILDTGIFTQSMGITAGYSDTSYYSYIYDSTGGEK